MTPVVYEHFLKILPYTDILKFIERGEFLGSDRPLPDEGRYGYHNEPFFMQMHKDLLPLAEEVFEKRLKPSYLFFCLYNENGRLDLHTDKARAKYTIDYCIHGDKEWDIFIDDKPYTTRNNTAIFYNGNKSPHYRNKIPGKYMNMVFFHFASHDYEGNLNLNC